MNIESAKNKLKQLVDLVNSLSPSKTVEFHQQEKTDKHMSIKIIDSKLADGRLCIQPTSTGYDISLSSQLLDKKMSGYMNQLCKKECTGYKQSNSNSPFWRVSDFSLVQKATYYYAGATIKFDTATLLPEEIDLTNNYLEGSSKTISVNVYERNTVARKKCIEHYGCICMACSFNFETAYGALGKDYIHVHHVVPLSEVKQEYNLDPIKDLVPVCPNCHAMIHRSPKTLSIEELKQLLDNNLN